jgi:hypothetical protein
VPEAFPAYLAVQDGLMSDDVVPHLRNAVAWLGDKWHALRTYLA